MVVTNSVGLGLVMTIPPQDPDVSRMVLDELRVGAVLEPVILATSWFFWPSKPAELVGDCGTGCESDLKLPSYKKGVKHTHTL